MKKVLVTGGEGFIGSHLVELLVREGYNVKSTALYNSFNAHGWFSDLPGDIRKEVELMVGDVRDSRFVGEAVRGVDSVLHLAALIGIPYSYVAPESYVDTNIRGTLNVLEAARNEGGVRVLSTSTSEVYGTARYVPIDEKHPMQAQSPYSATKIAADRLCESYCKSFSLPVTIVRPFNTYGPRQSARAVIPAIIEQIVSGKQELELGALSPTRDLVFVRDTSMGFLKLLESEKSIGEEINIATETEISIGDLAALIMKLMDSHLPIKCTAERLRPEKSEVERLYGAASKLREVTGWSPSVSLTDGLRETINWFVRAKENSQLGDGSYTI